MRDGTIRWEWLGFAVVNMRANAYLKAGKYEPAIKPVRERANAVRHWLKARPEKELVLVSHGAFLTFLTEDWEDSWKNVGALLTVSITLYPRLWNHHRNRLGQRRVSNVSLEGQ